MRGRPQSTGVATGREQKQGTNVRSRRARLIDDAEKVHVEAPPLPIDSVPPLRDAKEEMQDFLDELLS
jgi:hypothetical protein